MRWIFYLFVIFLTACTSNSNEALQEVAMLNGDGDKLGTATLTEDAEGVSIKLKLEGVNPGWHGIHVHEFAKCESPDFASAGNHFNPEDKEHGLMNPEGPHLGDLPNVEADRDGKIDVELELPEATLLDGKNSLTREDGTSLVLHDSTDDGYTQPSGDSGERIACGEITVK